MRLSRARSLTVSVMIHAAVIAGILFFPAISFRRKPEARIYTVNIIKEASLRKKPPSLPKPVKKKKPKPKPKPKPKKKLVRKNIFSEKEKVKKKIKEREEKLDKKFVEPEEFMKEEKVEVETKDFDFPWYGDLVASKVYNSWVQPSKVVVGEKPLQAIIAFRIFNDGRASVLGVRSPSGRHLMDESALQAIDDAQPFPPFPRGWKGSSIDVTVTFDLAE